MKILIVVCLMTFACFVVWSFVENAAMKDFHLLVYEEAESFDSSAQDSDSGGSRVIQAFSNPRSVYDSEETGKRIRLLFQGGVRGIYLLGGCVLIVLFHREPGGSVSRVC